MTQRFNKTHAHGVSVVLLFADIVLYEAESIFQMHLKATTEKAKVSCSCEITP